MKITGTSSYVRIEYDNKIVKASGEMIVGGFIVFKNTMKQWEEPYHKEVFNDDIRDEIIQAVIEYCKDKDFKVEFE